MVIRKKDLVVDSVFSIQVPEYGYVLAQFRKDHHLEVFDCLRKEDSWKGVDLNNVPVLFNIVVAGHRLLGELQGQAPLKRPHAYTVRGLGLPLLR